MLLTIPNLDAPDWAVRLIRSFPEPWTSEEAKQPGGVLYSLFKAIGDDLERTIDNIEYARKAARVNEAIDNALDSVAQDFFGQVADFPADVIRAPGEPDSSFRNRIKASLLLPAATRQSLVDLLTRLTNDTPRVMEPWSPGDTCTWDHKSFYDVDTVENPFRIGDPGLKYQGFVESTLPSFGDQGDNPVYAMDKGWCWDSPSGYIIDPKPTWWMQVARIDALINKTKVFGTTVWRKYRGYPLTKIPLGGTLFAQPGVYEQTIEVFPEFAGTFVVVANANWNTAISYQQISNSQFKFVFSTPAPADAVVNWVATPIIYPGTGIGGVPVAAESASIGIAADFINSGLIVAPNWTTDYWLHARSSSLATIKFASAAPLEASISYKFFEPGKSGAAVVSAGQTQIVVPLSTREPYQPFCLPTWNTSVDIDKIGTAVKFSFSTPPPDPSYLYWAFHES